MAARCVKVGVVAALVAGALVLAPSSGAGQAAPAGKAWTPPRTPDGQPDIQGFWANQGRRLATYNIEAMEGASETHTLLSGVQSDSQSLIVDPADGKIPYQPWARAKRQDVFDNHTNPTKWEHVDPHTLCWLSGIPRMFYQGTTQILQIPGYVIVLQEFNHAYRVIHLDGRPHVPANLTLWMGDSRGRWDGNTLVIDVTNLSGYNWLDDAGNFYTDSAHLVERLTMVDQDTVLYEVTIDDPKVYMRPWRVAWALVREKEPGFQLLEEACWEGERDLGRLREAGYQFYSGDNWRRR